MVGDERRGARALPGPRLGDLQRAAGTVAGGDVSGDVLLVRDHDAAAADVEELDAGRGDVLQGGYDVADGAAAREPAQTGVQRLGIDAHSSSSSIDGLGRCTGSVT